ncbi:MAG TPA: restriction endonuclease subunit S [Flavobacterium sp.]|nr:restriction endonuclease subunit S [Flavobacterium sp.]
MFPKLRFKEFDGDLTESKLVELTSWASGGTPAKDVPEYWGDDIPLISGASMHTNQLYESDVKITKLGLQKGSKLAPKDSILILVRGSMLFNKIPMGITLGDVAFNQDVKCIRPKQQLAPLFLFQWLHAKENTIQNKVTATGIGAGKLDTADLQNLKLYKPSLEEQTKIATFLSAVDEKISQLTQKHALLSQYKQGMMQKLFSQQIRFKADDGGEFAKWEDSKLGELTTLITKGTTPSSLGEKYEESGINFIKIESLSSNGKFLLDKFAYIDENTHNKLARSKLEHDDILFSIAGALGRVAIISRDYLPANTNQALAIIRLKDKKITRYIYYFLNSDYVKKIIDAESVQLAQANFSLGQLANLDVLVPCLEEQTKIANFLSAIDQKIEVVAQQIEQAKTWKKGLLQQMFI